MAKAASYMKDIRAQVKEIILSTMTPDDKYKGVLNAEKAVEKAISCRDEALEEQAAQQKEQA